MKSCNIKGTPRIIQTNTLNIPFTALFLLIVQKEMASPKGRARSKVKTNNKQVIAKPSKRLCVTVINSIIKFLKCGYLIWSV